MNWITNSLAARPWLTRWFLGAVAIVVAACGPSGGKPGY
jgi:hypothetical protein